MQAITTKFHGHTNTRGSRVSATGFGGKRVTLAWDYEETSERNHQLAMAVLCRKIGMRGTFAQAETATGFVYVHVSEFNKVVVDD